ncbi:MAG: hypothetical protein QXT25_00725 [Candidatus Anstonellaceae archaeon]
MRQKLQAFAKAILLLVILFSPLCHSDFTMRSISVFIRINQDGSANIEEKFTIMLNGSSRQIYEDTRAVFSDLATWRERTGLSEVRHHISRAYADIKNLRVLPQAIERCNPYLDLCHATLILTYEVPASKQGSGLVKVDWYKPRTAKYSIQTPALSFEQTRTGDLILPPNTNIVFAIPPIAEKIYFSSLPFNIAEEDESQFRYDYTSNLRYYIGKERVFSWKGDTLSKFQFTFEIEYPLETEAIEFFKEAQAAVLGLFLGQDGLAAILLFAAAAASLYYFNRLEK